ncbi:polysaccharide deacetylase [Capsulimonas corticalis]|uniref:Polysaccharide deacetylase n=1 Tax=Capsulimonas corticalis TaxID=2219043 RepID=A0A402CXW6_9BACT|nr:polysaccharide deacetylase family protein [Capsulimonas corticalis]BDI32150.1 polysaccharide deacetylase [Capsulimonas corticalis]
MSDWSPVPILMYHAVEDAPRAPQYKHFYVTRSEFAAQMRMLKRGGYTPITFPILAEAMAGGATLPAKPVLLTFDDGYENLLTNAHPLLRDLNFPYTVFLVSERIGKTNEWVIEEGFDATPLLDWNQIREMAAWDGVSFQAHTATHPHLNRIGQDQLRRELTVSKQQLEQELQLPMDVLCYPYGHLSEEVVAETRAAGYAMAVTTEFGRVRRGDDPLRLPRISVYHVPFLSLTYGVGPLNFDWRLRTRKDSRSAPNG